MGLLSLQQPSPQSHQQGLPHPHYQHSRPSSVVQQQPQSQHHYHHQPNSGIHQQPSYATTSQSQSPATSHPDGISYYSTYSTHNSAGAYPSTDSSDMMAAAQVQRHYPPIYHTPQSNSPASVASPSQHDQHRSIYGQPPAQQMHHQSMYYQSQQYPPLSATASSYGQHPQHAQAHQSMSPQPNLMMSHGQQSHVPGSHMSQGQMPQPGQMTQSPLTHSTPQMGTPQMPQHQHQHQHQQHSVQQQSQSVTDSPRHPGAMKMEGQMSLQIQKPPPGQQQQHGGPNTTPLSTPTTGNPAQINPSAAPGPIPATTPLVVREDNNGVQWIAFEYSRDRVKMEYTIRCDVESVNQDGLSPEFKQENCVYPRACVPKEEYRGNRLAYETECNTVGWALAELNPPLQGKRGLIQRAVDSWRNSNRDPKLRSRRVRRMAKMSLRNSAKSNSPLVGPNGAASGMLGAPNVMGPSAGAMTKTGLGVMGQPMHHHDGSGQGDEVGMFHHQM